MTYRLVICSLAAFVLFGSQATAADWVRFRGPQGSGTSDERGLPQTWSDTENIAWKAELPGAGTSSPVIVGDRVFVTCYSGYGLDAADPGDKDKLVRHVVALDRTTGKSVWSKPLMPKQTESSYSGGNNTWHGYASSTPTSDGQRLYVFFGASGVYCFDVADGAERWHADVGSKTAGWGSGNSLLLVDDLLIVNASIESGALLALNKQTGEVVWRADRIGGG
ncbi:MAG: PQQ-binding-like beta-propeller repeat protein, partial [Pirellulales bacterium]